MNENYLCSESGSVVLRNVVSLHLNGYPKEYDNQYTVMSNYFDLHLQYSDSSGKDQIHWCNKGASSLVLGRAGTVLKLPSLMFLTRQS